MSPELLEDLQNLSEAIAATEAAIEIGDSEAIAAATTETLHLIETLSILHCDVINHILSDHRQLNRRMGLREILVPLSHEGWHYVVDTEKP